MEKGLIICDEQVNISERSAYSNGIENGNSIHSNNTNLGYYLLYWDEILLLESEFFRSVLTSEEIESNGWRSTHLPMRYDELIQAGLLKRHICKFTDSSYVQSTGVELSESQKSDIVITAPIHIALLLEKAYKEVIKSPGKWSVQLDGNWRDVVDRTNLELKERLTIDFSLYGCLPAPSYNAPLDLVLDFKMNRQDELMALRANLDDLYLEIVDSSDLERSLIVKSERLANSITDLNSVFDETWAQKVMATKSVTLEVTAGSLLPGMTTAALATNYMNNVFGGLAVGATQTLLSSLKFNASLSNEINGISASQPDLRYISSMKNSRIC